MNEKEYISEKDELNLLINQGMSFSLERTTYKRRKGFIGRFLRPKAIKTTERYRIEEPTLSTLDRIASEQLELAIDENVMSSLDGVCEARKMSHAHARRMAKIVAYAVLGQDYIITEMVGSRIKYRKDDKKLEELTDIFYHNIKPSKLFTMVSMINTMSNLGDFTNSIRLMSASRTTMPIRIEAEKQED